MKNSNDNKIEGLDKPENYCGTSYAAQLLGLSVGTIQSLVDKNELHSWKTQGGHRRISLHSINKYIIKYKIKNAIPAPQEKQLRVLLVEDDPVTREMLSRYFENSKLPIDSTAMSSAMEALIDISNISPDLLITDLDMPGIDGFELLRSLRQNTQFDHMMILVLSALSAAEIEERGGLPEGSIFLNKPVKADWFYGFFAGIFLGKPKK